MFHVELRQRPHVARTFNLEEAEVIERFIAPLLAGRALTYSDRDWDPKSTKLTVLEGPELRVEDMGMGRGWGNAQRTGTDVTDRLLARARALAARPPELDRLKERILGRVDAGPLTLYRAVALAAELMSGRRASHCLALAEDAIWELLHDGAIDLIAGGRFASDRPEPQTGAPTGAPVIERQWQAHLIDWRSWAPEASCVQRHRLF
ncbi:MAG: hypothetical protein ACLP01_17520 [Solirubrobacteraceae bacterium]